MTLTKNIVAFLQRGVSLPNYKQDNRQLVCTVNSELMNLGYTLSEEAFESMSKSDPSDIKEWCEEVINYIKKQLGDDGNYTPIHRGFPDSVIEMTEFDKYITQLISYWTDGKIVPFEIEGSEYKFEYTEFKELNVIEDFDSIFTNLVSLNAGLAPLDQKIVDWFTFNYDLDDLTKLMPDSIPFKETLCKLAGFGLDVPVKTPTDVLRIAAYLSYGETDLVLPKKMIKNGWGRTMTENPEWKKRRWKLTNLQKRLVMNFLEKVAYPSEMITRRGMWVTLAHQIHSSKYEHSHPKAYKALQLMRRKRDYPKSWYGKVDAAFNISIEDGLKKLSERPGEYARRLDALIRNNPASVNEILDVFRECAIKVSNKVLFELYTHFNTRLKPQTIRQVWTGEKRRPTPLPLLSPIKEDVVENIIETIWNILYDKFSLLDPLGKTWIDPKLKDIPLPTNMKSLSESLEVVIRGQRNPFVADKSFLRLYCHWKGSDDLDLTCLTIDNKGEVNKAGFGGSDHNHIYFSGDNTGNYAENSEYIDINLNKTAVKYVMMVVNQYRGGSVSKSDARIGWMERDNTSMTKIWIPKTVTNSFKVTSQAQQVNFCIFDIETKEWILVDEDAKSKSVSSSTEILDYITSLSEAPKYSVYDLLKLHVEARGEEVTEIEEDTETVFKYDDFSKSYKKTLEFML